jgi:hypothetical protein
LHVGCPRLNIGIFLVPGVLGDHAEIHRTCDERALILESDLVD